MDEKTSPVEHLLESVASALAARRGPMLERVRGIELALESYRRASEAELAREFAREHQLRQPAPAAVSAERAAELVLAAVQALPELRERASPISAAAPTESSAPVPRASRDPTHPVYPRLLERLGQGKVVVIGALSGRDRGSALPPELSGEVEWIDTERDGAHAIGNLPQRLRQGRVAAVVILDRAVQHKHTDPVMAAARDSGVPVAFAGQGGKASLLRALEQLELALTQSTT